MSLVRATLPVVLVASLAAPAFAAASPLLGTWNHDAAKSDDVEKAIEKAVEKVNFVIRGFAHTRLKNTNKPYGTIIILKKGDITSIKTDDRAAIEAPSSGAPIKWTREDGQKYDVSLSWKGDNHLEESFSNDEGKRVNVFTADGKGMKMEVTVTSGKLPVPLTYTLGYKR